MIFAPKQRTMSDTRYLLLSHSKINFMHNCTMFIQLKLRLPFWKKTKNSGVVKNYMDTLTIIQIIVPAHTANANATTNKGQVLAVLSIKTVVKYSVVGALVLPTNETSSSCIKSVYSWPRKLEHPKQFSTGISTSNLLIFSWEISLETTLFVLVYDILLQPKQQDFTRICFRISIKVKL